MTDRENVSNLALNVPTANEVTEFFRAWVPRYGFAILDDNGAVWVDPVTSKRMHRNHIVCIIRNDLLAAFPLMPKKLVLKLANGAANTIANRLLSQIRGGRGELLDVNDRYL